MPRQGNTVESCIIAGWKIQEGDTVEPDTPLCDVETDKATFEVPAGAAGTVLKRLWETGDDVPVLKPIAVIGSAAEDWAAALEQAAETAAAGLGAPERAPALPKAPPPAAAQNRPAGASPRARKRAEQAGLSLETGRVAGTGPEDRVLERDVEAALMAAPDFTAAAKAAALSGAPAPQTGTGFGGRVTSADMAAEQAAPPLPAFPHAGVDERPPSAGFTETPLKGIRKVISDRMLGSLAKSAQCTLTGSAPAQRLQTLRNRIKSAGERLGLADVSINSLILFAVSRKLPDFPFMNAHTIDDTLKIFKEVHLGAAVDTPRGLMVPVIRNADRLSARQIAAEAKRLAASCKSGAATPDELTGSTFTVTNLGALGITSFTPVLNPPEVAILGVCAITLQARLNDDGSTGFEPRIGLSLTINHQVVDGAPAARFLSALGNALADIDVFLL
jgi:pyruvate dehydrogenase E2 component (dihydrolipoamide acetyltransferase)